MDDQALALEREKQLSASRSGMCGFVPVTLVFLTWFDSVEFYLEFEDTSSAATFGSCYATGSQHLPRYSLCFKTSDKKQTFFLNKTTLSPSTLLPAITYLISHEELTQLISLALAAQHPQFLRRWVWGVK